MLGKACVNRVHNNYAFVNVRWKLAYEKNIRY